jgi:hypothetical protein
MNQYTGTSYSFSLRNGTASNSTLLASRTCSTQAQASPPAAPRWLSVMTESSNTIRLNWPSVSGATGYYVYRCIGSTQYLNHTLGSCPPNVSPCRQDNCTPVAQVATVGASIPTRYYDTGVHSRTRYFYRVRAYNSSGVSNYSERGGSRTYPIGRPSFASCQTLSSSQIRVNWNPVNQASGYIIYYLVGNDYHRWADGTSNSTSYLHSNLPSATYRYAPTAYETVNGGMVGGDGHYHPPPSCSTGPGQYWLQEIHRDGFDNRCNINQRLATVYYAFHYGSNISLHMERYDRTTRQTIYLGSVNLGSGNRSGYYTINNILLNNNYSFWLRSGSNRVILILTGCHT